MRNIAAAALLICAAIFASPVAAQPRRAAVPSVSQIINFSLMEALVAVKAEDLAGVFAFIPENKSSMAMADYLMHNHRAMKRFAKKVTEDLEETQGINEWDKEVLLYVVGMNNSPGLPAGVKRLSKRLNRKVSRLSLAPSIPLSVMVQRRASKR